MKEVKLLNEYRMKLISSMNYSCSCEIMGLSSTYQNVFKKINESIYTKTELGIFIIRGLKINGV